MYKHALFSAIINTNLLTRFIAPFSRDISSHRYVNRKGAASLDGEKLPKESFIHLVPEFCDVHRFPASMWRQAMWIPSIFYRLNSLLLADELRIEIQAKTGLGISVLSSSMCTHLKKCVDF